MTLTDAGSVVVDGTVHSFEAHTAALRAARQLPGVQHVDDRLAIRLTVGY
jgi:osmotically-inducible protein OsmY